MVEGGIKKKITGSREKNAFMTTLENGTDFFPSFLHWKTERESVGFFFRWSHFAASEEEKKMCRCVKSTSLSLITTEDFFFLATVENKISGKEREI